MSASKARGRAARRSNRAVERSGTEPEREPARIGSFAAAAVSGVLYFTAFPGFDVWPLAFVCLVPLHLALARAKTRKRAFWLGATMGLVTNWGGYYWLVGFMQTFSGFPLPVGILFTTLLCAYQGGVFAVYAVLHHSGTRAALTPLLVAPVAMVAAEFAYPLLFPSFTANCLYEAPLLIQAADLFGPLGITAVIVLANAALSEAILRRREGARAMLRAFAPGVAGVALLAGYGALRMPGIQAASDAATPLVVGIAQSNMGTYQKHEDPEEGLRRHRVLSGRILEEGEVDLLVWPESAYVWPLSENVRSVHRRVLGGLPGPLLFGGLMRREGKVFNTALLTDADGRIVDTYDKVHLLAFGEYLPLGETFPILYEWSPHSGRFTRGTDLEPLRFGRWRISALICYEDILPRFVRDLVREGDPHLFVNMTNDAWFGDSTEPVIHLALSVFRSIEHRRWLVRATNTGISALVDPLGRIVARGPVFDQATLRGEVRLMRRWTLYRTVGDILGWTSLVAWGAFWLWRRRARKARDGAHPS